MNEEDEVLVVKRQVRQPRMRHAADQMTDSFQAHKDDTAIRVT